jgi:hypothetical protein
VFLLSLKRSSKPARARPGRTRSSSTRGSRATPRKACPRRNPGWEPVSGNGAAQATG